MTLENVNTQACQHKSIALKYFSPCNMLCSPLYSRTGVYRGIPIFLSFDPKHRLWVLVRTASARRFLHLRVTTIYVLNQCSKNTTIYVLNKSSKIFLVDEIFHFFF